MWDDPSIDEISAEYLCGDYPSVRYGPPSGPFYPDILARLAPRPGVTRFRSLEEAQEARARETRARMRRIRAERGGDP